MKEFAFVDTTHITLEEKSYIYGLLITDGSMNISNIESYSGNIQLEVSAKDRDIVDKLCNIVPYSTKRERTRNTNFSNNYHSVSFNISRQYFIKELIDFGFPIENKTDNTRPPIVEYDKNAFWRGVLDGDGSIGIRHESNGNLKAYLSLTTKSEVLKEAFCEYLSSITGQQYNPQRNKRDNIYNIGSAGYAACKVLKEIYKDCTIYLNRKYNKYLECLQWEKEQQTRERKPRVYHKRVVAEETREKLSKAAKERFTKPEDNPMYGRHHSEESKKKIKDANIKIWENEDYRKRISESRKGMNNGAKNHNARKIVQLSLDNIFIKNWDYIGEAANYYNVNEASIRGCCNGKQKTSCGFKWMYKEDYEEWVINGVL